MKKTVILLLAAILALSCSSLPSFLAPTPTPTQTFTPLPTFTATPTSTPTPTPTATIVPPDPPETGYSNVYGRVLLQGQPAENVQMHLSNIGTDYAEFYYEIERSDSDGRFVFTNVPPGDGFGLVALGIAGAVEVTLLVPADSNMNFGEYRLIPTDLALLSPERKSELTDTPPSLNWEAYPGAAYYHVELKQLYGNYTDLEMDTDETHLDLELPLLECTYGWDVTAYNAAGIPLARSDSAYVDDEDKFFQKYDGIFTIKNDLLPWCHLQLFSPVNGAKITSGRIEFLWDHHPLAARYGVSITRRYNDTLKGIHIFDPGFFYGNFTVREDGSLAGPSLPYFVQGTYYWTVRAYTEDGSFIAASAEYEFWVP